MSSGISEMDPVLAVEQLSAGYGSQTIVHDICLSVHSGEVVAVIGANGSGKSTIAKAVLGLCRVRSGSIRLAGRELAGRRTSAIARAGLGYVPQLDNVFNELTVRENLEMGGYTSRPRDVRERMAQVLDVFPELKTTLKKRAKELSGGQRGMVGVGRALMSSPKVVILDEPTAGLAPRYKAAVWDHTLRVAQSGVGVLVVEQAARAAIQNSQRCYVVATGRIAEELESDAVGDVAEVAGFYLGV